jgi:hypothetical protein
MNPYRGPPMTLGNAAAAGGRLIAWCRQCGHEVEPDPGEMAELLFFAVAERVVAEVRGETVAPHGDVLPI